MMVANLPSRDMYRDSLQDPIYNCPVFHEWSLHRYLEELLSVFSLPEYGPEDPECFPDDPLQTVRKCMVCWLHFAAPAIRLEPYLL
jgi:hypothetical protein